MFQQLLLQEARVSRRVEGTDRFNQPKQTYQPQVTAPCRLTSGDGGETNTERSTDVYVVRHKLFLAPDVDVQEDDVVTVWDGDVQLLPETQVLLKRVVYDGRGPHHIECVLEVQRGPQ